MHVCANSVCACVRVCVREREQNDISVVVCVWWEGGAGGVTTSRQTVRGTTKKIDDNKKNDIKRIKNNSR